jgi:ribosomal small subunit protein bTHX
MGRGDIKSKKGKIRAGSFGVSRPRKKSKVSTAVKVESAPVVEASKPKKIVAKAKAPAKKK